MTDGVVENLPSAPEHEVEDRGAQRLAALAAVGVLRSEGVKRVLELLYGEAARTDLDLLL